MLLARRVDWRVVAMGSLPNCPRKDVLISFASMLSLCLDSLEHATA